MAAINLRARRRKVNLTAFQRCTPLRAKRKQLTLVCRLKGKI
jgi:hypothetical protein